MMRFIKSLYMYLKAPRRVKALFGDFARMGITTPEQVEAMSADVFLAILARHYTSLDEAYEEYTRWCGHE